MELTGDDFDDIFREGVTHILLTKRNHSRAADRVRAGSGAKSAIHAGDTDHACGQETEIDGEFNFTDKIGPLEVIEVAGKSPVEGALFWSDRGILIVGDAVVGNPPGRLGFLWEWVMDDPSHLRRSVRAFLNLDLDAVLVGDGVSILNDTKARLRALADTFQD